MTGILTYHYSMVIQTVETPEDEEEDELDDVSV
jgi:hypothetical protein